VRLSPGRPWSTGGHSRRRLKGLPLMHIQMTAAEEVNAKKLEKELNKVHQQHAELGISNSTARYSKRGWTRRT